MITAAIDLKTLDDLFNNQKKLDDVFSSIFDEDPFLSHSMSFNDDLPEGSDLVGDQDLYSNDYLLSNTRNNAYVQDKRNITYFLAPVVLEVATIYYCFLYFV